MRYLGLALYAEGPTDYWFLLPILRRLADDLCLREAIDQVQIGDVVPVDAPKKDRPPDRAARILAAVESVDGAFDILFVHTDGANDPKRARLEKVQPAIELLKRQSPRWADGTVAVVPVRETEAWALSDGDALRTALGSRLPDDQLGLPAKTAEVESLPDPKRSLDQAYLNAVGRRRPPRNGILAILAEQIRLEGLRNVPSFQNFEEDLRRALRDLRFIPG
ncbi:DUF4276 family protein [Tundrisphaera lichenicola]|uniref:DUF4276 family protein n=1 Tax=Tundrisphaera lichenicola TaxID=2029860 RepID=UPI003EBB650B